MKKKKFYEEFNEDQSYQKVCDHCHYTWKYRSTEHSICTIKCKKPKKIPVVFHNFCNYDYQFIIKEVTEESEGQLQCLG